MVRFYGRGFWRCGRAICWPLRRKHAFRAMHCLLIRCYQQQCGALAQRPEMPAAAAAQFLEKAALLSSPDVNFWPGRESLLHRMTHANFSAQVGVELAFARPIGQAQSEKYVTMSCSPWPTLERRLSLRCNARCRGANGVQALPSSCGPWRRGEGALWLGDGLHARPARFGVWQSCR